MDTISNSQLLDELLNSDISAPTKSALVVRKDNYRDLVAFGNVTSYSMQQTLKACARKFQLQKLGADLEGESVREPNCDFAFGHAVGAGVATYDQTGDVRQAIWSAFLAWSIDLLEEAPKKTNRPNPNKTFWHAVWAIHVYATFVEEETDLQEYEVDKVEATIAVDFEDGHFYVGHIDELLRHKETGKLKVKENKTTVYGTIDPAQYENSEQALSYALVVDQLGAAEYDVLYTVYSSTEQRWLQFEFTKSALAKAEWLQSQFFIHSDIEMYEDYNFFPKNGGSCLSFGRRCEHYETCGMNADRIFGKKFSELRRLESLGQLEEIEPIDYAFKVSEIKQRMEQGLEQEESV
jgi:hypothetical protein